MNKIVKKEDNILLALMKEVEDKIAVIRNQEVIADADVAYLYGVETREVNQAVKNNVDKFPSSYMFELNTSELRDLKSKILISNVSPNVRKPIAEVFGEEYFRQRDELKTINDPLTLNSQLSTSGTCS